MRQNTDALERALDTTQNELREVGERQQLWTRFPCTCARADCEMEHPHRHQITYQLDALAAHWNTDAASAADQDALRSAVVNLADRLALWGEAGAPEGDAYSLLHHVRDLWFARIGTPVGGVPDDAWMEQLYLVEARNRRLMEMLLAALARQRFDRLADAGARHARLRTTRLTREGVFGCRRTITAWMDDSDLLPERTTLRETLLMFVRSAEWTQGEAADVIQMAEDATNAVLAFGIAHEDWTQASYGAMEDVIPFVSLRTALVLEDEPVAAA